jgi:hypothetical protein
LIVLPTPLLPHRSMLYAQEKVYDWPKDRYEGDYEGYGNNPRQRADLIAFLRTLLNPPTLVVFSGDVHHGSVVDGLYVGGAPLDQIYRGKGKWAMRVIQVTSSPIKNIKVEAYVEPHWTGLFQTDAGNVGELVVAQYENQFRSLPDGTAIAMRAQVRTLKGPLGRETYIYENHLCVVDIAASIEILFVGVEAVRYPATLQLVPGFTGGRLRTATTSVPTTNDPTTFTPPLKWLEEQARVGVGAGSRALRT